MRYATSKEQRDFFSRNGFIEFEGIYSKQEIEDLLGAINAAQKKRGASKALELGRDLFRESPEIKRSVAKRRLAEIVSELARCKPLRLGFDQLLVPGKLPWKDAPLQEIAPFQGVAGGALVCLQGGGNGDEFSLFPQKAGNVTILRKETPINFSELDGRNGELFLLIAYTSSSALYILQENDPLTHSLKNLGYVFGDRLKEEFHPTLYK